MSSLSWAVYKNNSRCKLFILNFIFLFLHWSVSWKGTGSRRELALQDSEDFPFFTNSSEVPEECSLCTQAAAMTDQLPQKAGEKRPNNHEHYEEENGGTPKKQKVDLEDGSRRMVTIQYVYCLVWSKKQQNPVNKLFWVVNCALFNS